ncbi:hypothetical protein Q8A67_000664 [Cirrhinus molitorella]|uniref:C2 domain-containing protein n=1 Tax=Cirrhinus molitorella TaxID=172907 RepID=A0AA88QGC5_9TELE|nr:hypothetical protein Q8A67_000664 [Cirrhinus molitorella]
MSGDWEDDLCKKALVLVEELCFRSGGLSQSASCQEFSYMMRGPNRQLNTEISVSLLSVIVTFCGIVLLSVSLFVSWKLCWLPWRDKEGGGLSLTSGLLPGGASLGGVGGGGGAALLPPLLQRKDTQSSSSLYPSLSQHGQHHPHFSDLMGVESGGGLRTQKFPDSSKRIMVTLTCLSCSTEQLVVKILKALDLPAKDANGFSDPYVKIYLLPDRKKKFQTKVHRKTLNPIFNETFQFGVPLAELHARKLHFSIYDFDRFSRHDLIGQVVVDNLLDFSEGTGEKPIWRDIVEGTAEKADLGELNFSLCYLPTAGRLTVTIIKATNLKAMDLTGFSDPYVKASLVCEGRRLKKRKTSIKKNTLNPTYNEALVFDIPNENIENVSLIIAVMDYDCIGHNEVIGMCRVGSDADGPGREHWTAMLANPRKPIEHWHQLVEEKSINTYVSKSATASPKPHIVVDSPHSE